MRATYATAGVVPTLVIAKVEAAKAVTVMLRTILAVDVRRDGKAVGTPSP